MKPRRYVGMLDGVQAVLAAATAQAASRNLLAVGPALLLLGLLDAAAELFVRLGLDAGTLRDEVATGMPGPDAPATGRTPALSREAEGVLERAAEQAEAEGAGGILPGFILAAIAEERFHGRVLRLAGARAERIRETLGLRPLPPPDQSAYLALKAAREAAGEVIEERHLLYGLLTAADDVVVLLPRLGIDLEAARRRVKESLGPPDPLPVQKPFAHPMKEILENAGRETLRRDAFRPSGSDLLIALLAEPWGLVPRILREEWGLTAEKVRAAR